MTDDFPTPNIESLISDAKRAGLVRIADKAADELYVMRRLVQGATEVQAKILELQAENKSLLEANEKHDRMLP